MSVASTLSDGGAQSAASLASRYATQRRALLSSGGGPGASRRQGLSALTDAWLREVFRQAVGSTTGTAAVALVAVGGYGRGELSPGSDLDLVLLQADRRQSTAVGELADAVWYPVWDSGVRLDHSVRTFEEARRLASRDLAVLLGLLDARHVAGDEAVVARLRSSVLADWRAAARRRLPELHDSWVRRGLRHGDLRHDLEPDLKEGRGGLRDFVSLRAVAASWLADRPHRDVDDAVRRLADVRDALQQATGRHGNRLLLQEQDRVAQLLGGDADGLLRDVGAAAAAVSHAADVTWRRALQAARPSRSRHLRSRSPVLRLLGPGLAEHDGEAVLTAGADVTGDALLTLRFAARAARAGLPLAPSSLDRLAAAAPRLPVPWPDGARDLLVDLLGAGSALVPVWEALDQAGLVERLLPEWSSVRHRPQRNAVHRFSVDRHLVETAVCAAQRIREVRRPDLLLVAALLHDIGKGTAGDHSEQGALVAATVATRLGFGEDDVRTVTTLVRHHLLLVETATRRDLDDPATVERVATAVGGRDVLDLLHSLTLADASATGPAAWSGWKEGLVHELVRRVGLGLEGAPPAAQPPLTTAQSALLAAGQLAVVAQPTAASAWVVTVAAPDVPGLFTTVAGVLAIHRLSVRAAQIRTEAGSTGETALDEWTVLPERGDEPRAAALRNDIARALSGELDVTSRLAARDGSRRTPRVATAPPRVDVVEGASRTATVLEVRAADRPGLLHGLGRSLAAAGMAVRAARVATLGAEAVDVFYLQDGDGPLDDGTAREVARLLTDAAG